MVSPVRKSGHGARLYGSVKGWTYGDLRHPPEHHAQPFCRFANQTPDYLQS
jgi:hypothetical protein